MTSQMVTQFLGTDKISVQQELFYAGKGLGYLLPLPNNQKFPVPKGFTGEEGIDPSPMDYANFDASYDTPNAALRLAYDVFVMDVDQHEKNGVAVDGMANLEEWQYEHSCNLDAVMAYCMTRGNPYKEGHFFFRYPGGTTRGEVCPGVDVLRRGHRYSVCYPSIVDGRQYRWYEKRGEYWVQMTEPPSVDDLPEAPEKLVEFLKDGARDAKRRATPEATDDFVSDMLADDRPMAIQVHRALLRGLEELEEATTSGASRHDAMLKAIFRLVMKCANGYPGLQEAIDELFAVWQDYKDKPDGEFERMTRDALEKATYEYDEYKAIGTYEDAYGKSYLSVNEQGWW